MTRKIDEEVLTMKRIARLLAPMDAHARARVLAWVVSRYADPILGELVAAAVLRQAKATALGGQP